jgi:hypothetical protein
MTAKKPQAAKPHSPHVPIKSVLGFLVANKAQLKRLPQWKIQAHPELFISSPMAPKALSPRTPSRRSR